MTETKTTRTVIAAQPGWYLIKQGAEFYLDPIIAWKIEHHEGTIHGSRRRWSTHHAEPITFGGGDLGIVDYAIKRPDGVFEVGDRWFTDEAAALAYLRDETTPDQTKTFDTVVG